MKENDNFRGITQSLGRIGGVAGFGLAAVTPLVACILFAVWLRGKYAMGEWIIVLAIIVGLISSACGAYRSIKSFLDSEHRRDAEKEPPVIPKRSADPNEAWHVGNSHDENNL